MAVQLREVRAAPEDLTRFPRNRSEGDIPRIGLVTSIYDPEECISRKIGIDAASTEPTDEGRIHLFTGEGAADYANASGRVFTTDSSFTWILGDGSPYANWRPAAHAARARARIHASGPGIVRANRYGQTETARCRQVTFGSVRSPRLEGWPCSE